MDHAAPCGTFWSLVREDWHAHNRQWTRCGFRAMAVYRFGVWRMSVRPKLVRAPLSILYRFLFRHVRNVYGIELPSSCKVGRRLIIEHQHGIIVHGESEIGDDCLIRQGVTIGIRRVDRPFDAPVLGHRVDVGAGAKILGGIRIGNDAKVGANAVVLHDVPDGTAVAGIPARPIGSGGGSAAS